VALASPSTSPAALPDGRVYELVSPAEKGGSQAAAQIDQGASGGGQSVSTAFYSLASGEGDSALFWGSGPMGVTPDGYPSDYFIAQRTASGWTTRSAIPRTLEPYIFAGLGAGWLLPSADFSSLAFVDPEHEFDPEPDTRCSSNIFLAGADPFQQPAWLAEPRVANPIVNCTGQEATASGSAIVGGAPDLSTIYFAYGGTLLPEDDARGADVIQQSVLTAVGELESTIGPWGFYEEHEGVVSEAGVLPDGSIDPFGAVPLVMGAAEDGRPQHEAAASVNGNDVSADGSRAFFLSPDPHYSTTSGIEAVFCGDVQCTSAPPELYVRVTAADGAKSTELVSEDELSPASDGRPAAAPDGPLAHPSALTGASPAFMYASPDGSHAFFESVDRLTSEAPGGSTAKAYDFDVDTGSLAYLPGVEGPILASSTDGSRFAFEDTMSSPTQLALWTAGPGGGTVTDVAPLTGSHGCGELECVPAARMSPDGSVLVFSTKAPIAGFNNGDGAVEEIYRYDPADSELSCVSCPPAGTTPSGSARLSLADQASSAGADDGPVDERGMSADGSRIFFDTPDALVPRDVNGTRDVYEWEAGHVYLLSSGTSADESIFLDNSESGGDVFFATTAGLVPTDTDGGYDVYDARVPRPGDEPPAGAAGCEGEACQTPTGEGTLGQVPASATFSGAEDPVAPTEAKSVARPAATPVTHPRAKRKIRHKKKRKKTRGSGKTTRGSAKRASSRRTARR
jgi:hypothetical protein